LLLLLAHCSGGGLERNAFKENFNKYKCTSHLAGQRLKNLLHHLLNHKLIKINRSTASSI